MSIKALAGRQLTIITTDNCTARCPHCVMCCVPGQKQSLTFEQMRAAIDEFNAAVPLALVVFTGGEPTLLLEDLLKAIRYAAERGILTRLVTNCHWASSRTRAKKMLERLREAGLGELNFSLDDYHAPYVPVKNVIRAWKASKGMGFSAVVIANSHGEHDKYVPETIEELLGEKVTIRRQKDRYKVRNDPKDADGTLYIIAEALLQNTGRAADAVEQDNFVCFEAQDSLLTGCRWVGSQPAVSYDNHLWACCGIRCDKNELLELGNLAEESAVDILQRAADSVLLNAIHQMGPLWLCRFVSAVEPSITFRKDFHSVCEVCEALTTNHDAISVLREHYAEIAGQIMACEERNAAEEKQREKGNGE